jgi:hypothetical protein
LHNVEIREETIYAWLKENSPDFVKESLKNAPTNLPSTVKAITDDDLEDSNINFKLLEDGQRLLMWWE